jgi:hypothetical protein
MAITKYIVSVDSDTGKPIKLERMDEEGAVTEVDTSLLFPAHENTGPGVSIAVNIYAGGYPGGTTVYTGSAVGQAGGAGPQPASGQMVAAHVSGPPH